MADRPASTEEIRLTSEVPSTREESSSKRVRTKSAKFATNSNSEQRNYQQAMRNSKKEFKRVDHANISIPDAPTYHPTIEEFRNPLEYINKIRAEAEQFGIAKIVPPVEWNPTCNINMKNPDVFPTKLQQVNTLQEGQGFDEGPNYNMENYKIMADDFEKEWKEKYYTENQPSLMSLASDYWAAVETGVRKPLVQYGSDLDTTRYCSGFTQKVTTSGIEGRREGLQGRNKAKNAGDGMFSPSYYERTGWNLNNISACEGSVLKYIQTPINGVNVPWLYVGMLFSSFCWHNEDSYLYSISYNHLGATKQWYGVPGSEAKNFEKVSKDFLMQLFRESPDQLHHMTTQISPSLLVSQGIPVYQIKHEPKSFLVTFPKAFHAGFNYGFNIAEAANFATYDWLAAGCEAEERYRTFARSSVFSNHRLLFTLFHHKGDVEPHLHTKLAVEVLKVLEEEIAYRPYILEQGVRDISATIKLPPNSFDAIDLVAADYDDMRRCCICKHICVFTAIACECNKTKVACIRHFQTLCKCSKKKKYALEWAKTHDLQALHLQIKNAQFPSVLKMENEATNCLKEVVAKPDSDMNIPSYLPSLIPTHSSSSISINCTSFLSSSSSSSPSSSSSFS